MGYYENPPMLNLSRGTEKITAGIMDAANSISNALIRRGDNKREEEKQRKLSVQRIQEEKNRVDLFYADQLSNWEIKNPSDNNDINSQAKVMLQEKIKLAADARLALTMETDPAKRDEYLKHITNANKFMDVAAKASKGFSMEASTYSDVNAISMNVPGGWAVTGDGNVRKDRTSALDIMSKRTADFEDSGIRLVDKGDSFDVEFYGKRKGDGSEFKTTISALDYVNSDENGNGGLLQKVANADEFFTEARKTIYDPKSNEIYNEMIDPVGMRTVDLGNGYQLAKAQKLNLEKATEKIREKAEIKAAGYLKVNKPSDMASLVNWTLGMGEGYYENVFLKTDDGGLLDPEGQKNRLSDLLTEKAIYNTFGTHKTTNNGKDIWLSGIPVQVKPGKVDKDTGVEKVTKSTAPSSNRVFSEDEVNEYVKDYADLAATKGKAGYGELIVNIKGPKGGRGKDVKFSVQKGKIYSDQSTRPVSLTDFKNFLRKQTYGLPVINNKTK